MWWKKNKRKIIAALLIIAVLALAFYLGGSAPGSRGWSISGSGTDEAVSDAPSDAPETESPEYEEPEESGAPETDAPETPENTPETSQTPEETPLPSAVPTEEPVYIPDYDPDYDRDTAAQPTTEINPSAGQDKYKTDPVPTGKPLPVEPQDVQIGTAAHTCTISIYCGTILDNMQLCDREKTGLVPGDGWILKPVQVTFYEGESVFNVLLRTCKQMKIHMEYQNTPMYNSAYIEGIGNLYELDVGDLSGWMYRVNDWFPNYGCSRYQLKDGDVIEWVYTCDLGFDVGGRNVIEPIRGAE